MAVHVSPWLLLLLVTALTASDIVTSAQSAEGGLKTDDKDTVEDNGEFKQDERMALAEKELLRAARVYGEAYLGSPSGRVVSCGKPTDAEFATWSGEDWDFGAEVTYTCINGYERTDGEPKLICGSGRQWKGPKITCTKIGCGNPGDANFASKSVTAITFGGKVTYTCNDGYVRSAGNTTLTCASNKEWEGTKPTCIPGVDCADLYNHGIRKSGVYAIRPSGDKAQKKAYCDMDTDGGGWTVFHHRESDSVSFYRKWLDYQNGFGNLTGNFWLGLDTIHALAPKEKPAVLRLDLQKWSGAKTIVLANVFSVGDAASKYILAMSSYKGPETNHLNYANGMKFSTYDNDNDKNGGNCAITYHAAWWYNNCHQHVNLNGKYYSSAVGNWNSMCYYNWDSNRSLKKAQMMVRPKDFKSG